MSSLPSPGNLQRTYTTCSPFLTLYLSDSWGQLPSPATVWRCHPWPHCQHTSGLTSPQRTGYSHPPLQHSNWVFTSTPATQRLGIHIHPCNTAIRYVYPVPHSTPCFPNSARIGYAEFNVALHPQIQTIMDGKLRMATSTFTHLLSSVGYATDGVLFISAHLSVSRHTQCHTTSLDFWHLPPNSAWTGYATEGDSSSLQLSTDAVSTLRKVGILMSL